MLNIGKMLTFVSKQAERLKSRERKPKVNKRNGQ